MLNSKQPNCIAILNANLETHWDTHTASIINPIVPKITQALRLRLRVNNNFQNERIITHIIIPDLFWPMEAEEFCGNFLAQRF